MKSHIVYALSDALLLEETYFFGDNGADTSVFSIYDELKQPHWDLNMYEITLKAYLQIVFVIHNLSKMFLFFRRKEIFAVKNLLKFVFIL